MRIYPDDFINKIILGDCLEVMKDIPDNSIDLIITSPPYNKKGFRGGKNTTGKNWKNCNIEYENYSDNLPEEQYKNLQVITLNEFYRIIKPNGSVFYNHKVRRYNNKASFPDFVLKSNLNLYQLIIWKRSGAHDKNIQYLFPTTELIFWLAKEKPKTFKNNANYKSEVWEMFQKPNSDHPAPFPIELPTNCILLTTTEGDLVLDPYAGIGTTLLASTIHNRNFIGIEIDEKYHKISEENLRENVL